jgi:FkbM family methyltransferase
VSWGLFRIRLRKLLAIAADSFYRRAFRLHGVAPAIEHVAVLDGVQFDFVVDVGANRGQFSLVCRRLRPGAMIVGFEPLSGPAAVYKAVFADDRRVIMHGCALGRKRGKIAMNISARDDSSSLLPITSTQTVNYPGTGTVATRMVAIGPLSDFVQQSDLGARNLMKIDVQGYELEVLKSADALLQCFDWIYVECSYVALYEGQPLAQEIMDYLAGQGFNLCGRFNPSYAKSGELLQGDLLFTRA